MASGWKKLGQPVPLSNLVSEREQRQIAAGARERALALFLVERAGAGALGAVLAQHVELPRASAAASTPPRSSELERVGLGAASLWLLRSEERRERERRRRW